MVYGPSELRIIGLIGAEDVAKDLDGMLDSILPTLAQYPQITFGSMGVAQDSPGKFRVMGNLTIRGKSQPVVIPVAVMRLDDGTYRVTGRTSSNSRRLESTRFG